MKVYNPNAIGVTTGFGVPTGGTSGQILTKVDGVNYSTQWANSAVPIGGTSGQVLVKNSNTDYDTQWVSLGEWSSYTQIPITGTTVNPTKAIDRIDKQRSRKINSNTHEVQIEYWQSGTSSVGSGDYVYALPTGITFGGNIQLYNGTSWDDAKQYVLPYAGIYSDTTRLRPIAIVPYTTLSYRLLIMDINLEGIFIGPRLGTDFGNANFSTKITFCTN